MPEFNNEVKTISSDRHFRYIPIDKGRPGWNMALDEAIFKEVLLGLSPPTLRFYTWTQPSVSIGYFQNPKSDLNLTMMDQRKIPWVRRITGGRGIFHQTELTYSFSAPLSLPASLLPHEIRGSYQKISLGFSRGLQRLGIPVQLFTQPPEGKNKRVSDLLLPDHKNNPLCFSSPSWYELLIEGKKVVGSAQKRNHRGFLQQGTILLSHQIEIFKTFFNLRSGIKPEFIGIFDYIKKEIPLPDLEKSLVAGLEDELGVIFIKDELTRRELMFAEELTERKYSTESWNMERVIFTRGAGHQSD